MCYYHSVHVTPEKSGLIGVKPGWYFQGADAKLHGPYDSQRLARAFERRYWESYNKTTANREGKVDDR